MKVSTDNHHLTKKRRNKESIHEMDREMWKAKKKKGKEIMVTNIEKINKKIKSQHLKDEVNIY